jgi:hypothetical protein
MVAPSLESRIAVLFHRLEGHRSLLANDRDVETALKNLAAEIRRPTDLRWSRDGRRLLCVVGEAITLTEGGERSPSQVLLGGNAAGSVRLTAPASFAGVQGRPGNDDVVSADYLHGETVVTVHAKGGVRVGGRKVAQVDGARLVRASSSGSHLAIVAENEGQSELRILGIDGTEHARVEGGLALGGVAWSPDGEQFAFRTRDALAIHDASGTRARTIDLAHLVEEHGEPTSGRVIWTTAGLFALHDAHVVRIGEGNRVDVLLGEGHAALSLAVTGDGRFAAITNTDARGGLRLFDTSTRETCEVPWASHFMPASPVAFSPSGHALVWIGYASQMQLVPFGDVPVDESGRAYDPQLAHLEQLRASARRVSDVEIRAAIDEIRTTPFRESLQTDASSVRSSLEALLRDRQKAASTQALFKAPPTAAFAVGDAVKHAKFGEGKVTAVDGGGETAKITVAFGDGARSMRPSFLQRA